MTNFLMHSPMTKTGTATMIAGTAVGRTSRHLGAQSVALARLCGALPPLLRFSDRRSTPFPQLPTPTGPGAAVVFGSSRCTEPGSPSHAPLIFFCILLKFQLVVIRVGWRECVVARCDRRVLAVGRVACLDSNVFNRYMLPTCHKRMEVQMTIYRMLPPMTKTGSATTIAGTAVERTSRHLGAQGVALARCCRALSAHPASLPGEAPLDPIPNSNRARCRDGPRIIVVHGTGESLPCPANHSFSIFCNFQVLLIHHLAFVSFRYN